MTRSFIHRVIRRRVIPRRRIPVPVRVPVVPIPVPVRHPPPALPTPFKKPDFRRDTLPPTFSLWFSAKFVLGEFCAAFVRAFVMAMLGSLAATLFKWWWTSPSSEDADPQRGYEYHAGDEGVQEEVEH